MRSRCRGQRGFTLIELLVVVAIVSILAALALPRYSSYKRNGVDAAVESTLNNARIAMEAYFEANNYTYAGITELMLAEKGFRRGSDFTLVIETTTVTQYVLRGCQIGGNYASFVYDSDLGKIIGDNANC